MRLFPNRNRVFARISLLLLTCALIPIAHAARCTVTSPSLAFGGYDAVAGTAVTSSATLNINCTGPGRKNHAVTVAFDAGANSSGVFNPRLMANTAGSDTLAYNLYINTTYTSANIWGDGTGGTQTVTVTTSASGRTTTASATVDGQIPASQDPLGVCPTTPCAYSDSVVITITF